MNIIIVLNILTLLTSVAVELTNFVLRKKELDHQIISCDITKDFFIDHYIEKEIFVELVFAIEHHKVNKLRRSFFFFFFFFLPFNYLRKIAECNFDWFLQIRKKYQI